MITRPLLEQMDVQKACCLHVTHPLPAKLPHSKSLPDARARRAATAEAAAAACTRCCRAGRLALLEREKSAEKERSLQKVTAPNAKSSQQPLPRLPRPAPAIMAPFLSPTPSCLKHLHACASASGVLAFEGRGPHAVLQTDWPGVVTATQSVQLVSWHAAEAL